MPDPCESSIVLFCLPNPNPTTRSQLDSFLSERTYPVDGLATRISGIYSSFWRWLPAKELAAWPKSRIKAEMLRRGFEIGRRSRDAQMCFANISLDPPLPGHSSRPLRRVGEYLRVV